MGRRKRLVRVTTALLLAAAAAICLWYARPLTVEELCPGIELEQCEGIYVDYSTYSDRGLENRATLSSKEEISPLLELMRGRKFSRSPFGWLPKGIKAHRVQDGDFKWSIDLAFEGVPLPDGNSGSGYMLRFNNFFGELEMSFDIECWFVRTANQEQWLEDVMAYILTLEPQSDSN